MRDVRRTTRVLRYPADPPTVEEIVAVMRTAADGVHGRRLRGLLVVLWRAGLIIRPRVRVSLTRPAIPLAMLNLGDLCSPLADR